MIFDRLDTQSFIEDFHRFYGIVLRVAIRYLGIFNDRDTYVSEPSIGDVKFNNSYIHSAP